jgi:hypothetical protein
MASHAVGEGEEQGVRLSIRRSQSDSVQIVFLMGPGAQALARRDEEAVLRR